nr:hypothetical protein [Sunxiuqinia sp.]
MKNLILIVFLLLPAILLAQATYYVSSEGNDTNAGTSTSDAWKSLAKVNSFIPAPGDQILFRRGDTWKGTLIPSASGNSGSPIVYGAYGSGNKPKIYGSTEVTGWTLHSGNIYKATFSSSSIEQLFVNGEKVDIARYPKTSYYDITSVNSSTSFTSSQISGGIDYTGATALIRTREWYLATNTVISSSSQTISINSAPAYNLNTGEGFVLLNKLDFLTQAGEWCFNPSTNTVYLWLADGSNPSGHTVRVSSGESNVSVASKNYINIE